MVDATADSTTHTSSALAKSEVTPRARGAGRFTFWSIGTLALALKVYEYGVTSDWAFLSGGLASAQLAQWAHVVVLLIEAGATAAIVSVAVTYVIVNQTIHNTTTDNSTTDNSTTTVIHGQNVESVVSAINSQLTDLRREIASFEAHLVRTEQAERERMEDFLKYAESKKIAEKDQQLESDRKMIAEVATALQNVVKTLNSGPT